MKTYLLSILLLTLPSLALAEGSATWGFHAAPLLKTRPDLLTVIETSLDVSPNGSGVRLGKDFEEKQGQRVPPFQFPARLKGSTGPYNLLLIIHGPEGISVDDASDVRIEIRPQP